jgi:nucleotide-binding universal stress UspA family protein
LRREIGPRLPGQVGRHPIRSMGEMKSSTARNMKQGTQAAGGLPNKPGVQAMMTIRKILTPTDFSPHSGCAFRLARALAHDYGARLLVLHVVEPPMIVSGEGVAPMEPEGFREQLRQRLLQWLAEEAQVPMDYGLTDGDPATAILRAADENQCDLIVMGTHGRTGLRRLLMGSVAEQVLRRASCPVLTVKAPFPPSEPVGADAGEAKEGAVEVGARSQ